MKNIQIINNKLLALNFNDYPLSLFYGKMGVCIYFYILSRIEPNDNYKHQAELLLDDILKESQNILDITMEYGLTGIGLGLNYLIKEKYIEGDINKILEDVDNLVFKRIAFMNNKKNNVHKTEFLYLLYYLYVRYKEQNSSEEKYLYNNSSLKISQA